MHILSAHERGSCSVAYSNIVNLDGTLKFLDFAQDKGLIDVRQGKDSLELRIGGVVGRLPVTPELAIDIAPKFPVSNLARLLAISDESLRRIAPVDRFYQITSDDGFIPEALIRGFANYLGSLLGDGVHKGYSRKEISCHPRPRINLHKSQQIYWSRKKMTNAIVEAFEFSPDNSINRLIKAATQQAMSLAQGNKKLSVECQIFADTLRCLYSVPENPLILTHADLYAALKRVPTFRDFYFLATPVAFEILRRSNVLHEYALTGITMPSFLLELDSIFESYIRNSLKQFAGKDTANLIVRNGNARAWSKRLFNDNKRYSIKPDLLIFSSPDGLKIVGDVKYKIKPVKEDRYQVISHALSYNANMALLIYPCSSSLIKGFRRLGVLGPAAHRIELFEYYFDLSGDLEAEEKQIFESVCRLAA